MSLCSSAMGPERVLPSSEDDLGEEQRPGEGGLLEGGVGWAGGRRGGGGGEEGEEEEELNSGYYYQPLNQEPDGPNGEEEGGEGGEAGGERGEAGGERGGEASHALQVQQVQHRIQVMGLHLPEAPPPDSEEEDDPEEAAAQRSRASIPMDPDHVELVKRTMAAVALPSLGVPPWARDISEDQWSHMVQHTLERHPARALNAPPPDSQPGP
ncbi:male-enhanced antigen 1 [Menidia menidia]